MKKRILAGVAIALTAALAAPTVPQASAAGDPTKTLAQILTAGGVGFDNNPNDYDIVTAAVIALKLDGVAADPSQNLTVFLPTDFAFRRLARDLGVRGPLSEQAIFDVLAKNPLLERIVKYHVIVGKRVTSQAAASLAGQPVTMFSGDSLTPQVRGRNTLFLRDGATRLSDPRVLVINIQASNGIAHGISRVLMPVNP